jgi:four helix bundle protein
MKEENLIADKSYRFAVRIVKAYLFLSKEQNEYTLSKQLLRSGTAIGALVSESRFAQSKADFINKLHIALKEANETRYWINLLHDTDFITQSMYNSIFPEIEELISILSAIIKTSKMKN